jgi:hypothetical protein
MSIRKSTWKDKDVKEVSDAAVYITKLLLFQYCLGLYITCTDCCSRAVVSRK